MNRENNSTPFAAALLGSIIGTVTTLAAVYLVREENRKRLMEIVGSAKTKVIETTSDSRKSISKNLRNLADQVEKTQA